MEFLGCGRCHCHRRGYRLGRRRGYRHRHRQSVIIVLPFILFEVVNNRSSTSRFIWIANMMFAKDFSRKMF